MEEILARNLNVRQTEELVKRWLAQSLQAEEATETDDDLDQDTPEEDANITYIEDRFRVALGTRVNLNRNNDGTGRLIVHFYSDDDLNNLFMLMAGEDDTL